MSTTTALPASETQAVALLEPCFLDLITAIEQAKDLPNRPGGIGLARYARSPNGWIALPPSFRPSGRQCGFPLRNCIMRGSARRPKRWRTTDRMCGRRCAGSARSRAPLSGARAFRPSGRVSCSNWKGQFGSGSTIWFVIARPDASDQPRSTMRSLTSIGATAPRTRAGHRTIPPGDLWCGPGTAVWQRWTDCRCSA